MPRLTIDNVAIDVPAGTTILQAARQLGMDIPSLCWHEGYRPTTSCMLCVVQVGDSARLVPSCATPVEDGMVVHSETDRVRELRRAGLELMLSDHSGDCLGPCELACPLGIDLPAMLRQVEAGEWDKAIATVRAHHALPAVISRICEGFCENACRRGQADAPAAIQLVEQSVAHRDLQSTLPYVPLVRPATGKRVAIVGAGSAGLSAAYHLRLAGHACTVFEQREQAGGRLRSEFDESRLPGHVLDAEIARLESLGISICLSARIDPDAGMESLRREFDAVLLATGGGVRIAVNPLTRETQASGVFAAGDAVNASRSIIRTVADGRLAAASMDQYLTLGHVHPGPRPFASRLGRLDEHALAAIMAEASPATRVSGTCTQEQVCTESGRCLHCDCESKHDCRLRRYARMYGVAAGRYRGERRTGIRIQRGQGVVYEPGKCILCGLCLQAAEKAGEKLGLAFVGRGFDVRVSVPFDGRIDEALVKAAQECIAICPSGALTHPGGKREA